MAQPRNRRPSVRRRRHPPVRRAWLYAPGAGQLRAASQPLADRGRHAGGRNGRSLGGGRRRPGRRAGASGRAAAGDHPARPHPGHRRRRLWLFGHLMRAAGALHPTTGSPRCRPCRRCRSCRLRAAPAHHAAPRPAGSSPSLISLAALIVGAGVVWLASWLRQPAAARSSPGCARSPACWTSWSALAFRYVAGWQPAGHGGRLRRSACSARRRGWWRALGATAGRPAAAAANWSATGMGR